MLGMHVGDTCTRHCSFILRVNSKISKPLVILYSNQHIYSVQHKSSRKRRTEEAGMVKKSPEN